jgi:hypothetical protein
LSDSKNSLVHLSKLRSRSLTYLLRQKEGKSDMESGKEGDKDYCERGGRERGRVRERERDVIDR